MFSEKYGYKTKKALMVNDISPLLRNRMWNLFYYSEIQAGGLSSPRLQSALTGKATIEDLIADRLGFLAGSSGKTSNVNLIQQYLVEDCKWHEAYDFVELHLSCLPEEKRQKRAAQYNELFEYEKSGYRVIAGEIAPITNAQEIETIEAAANTPYFSVNQHIRKSLEKYADLESPDYENSVKEAISAVEAICCIITGMSGAQATLGKALKKLKDSGVYIHPAMERAFDALYGYASDENGIRHGGIDFKNVPADDAKYMLISCSAFVNYLIEKWSKVQQKQTQGDN